MIDLNRATSATQEVMDTVNDQYTYHPWDEEKIIKGQRVRTALQDASLVIIENVPPGPDRSTALRKLREARMDANSALTHNGRY